MTDIVDLCNRQIQKMSDDIHRRVYTEPANSIYECIDCDIPIGIPRKTAIPWATRCIDCQTKYEKVR